jgi:hypothetical protein
MGGPRSRDAAGKQVGIFNFGRLEGRGIGAVEGVYAGDERGGDAAGIEGGVLGQVEEVGVGVAEDGVVADGVRGPEVAGIVFVEGLECWGWVSGWLLA